MAKLVKKENPRITYKQTGEIKRVNYSFNFYVGKEGDSKFKTHHVEIRFQDDEFFEAKFEFRGNYDRVDWHILSMIDNIITKIEKSIAKEQNELKGNPA